MPVGDTYIIGDANPMLVFDTKPMFFISFSSNDTVVTLGHNQSLTLQADTHETIIDAGQGLNLSFLGSNNITVVDFQHDPTGHINLLRDSAKPTLASDGHGGTLMTASNGVSVDFIKAHVTQSQVSEAA